MAVVTLALLTAPACTRDEASRPDGDSVSPPTTADAGGQDPPAYDDRRPRAVVLFSGRIAFPHVTLRTWSRGAFEIERVRRIDASTMRVLGRERTEGCSARPVRRLSSERLTRAHRDGGELVTRVVVVSREPAYVVQAVVQHVVA